MFVYRKQFDMIRVPGPEKLVFDHHQVVIIILLLPPHWSPLTEL